MRRRTDEIVVLGWIGVMVVVFATLVVIFLIFPPIDRGACLASHVVHHHQDGYITMRLDVRGDPSVEWVPSQDWDTTFCDRWEFPNGRAETN